MRLTIQKWGNSLAVRIPSTVARGAGLKQGSAVELAADQDTLFFKVLRRRKPMEASLGELLTRITPDNRHDLINVGPAVGREIVAE